MLGYVLLGYVQLSEGRLIFKTGNENVRGFYGTSLPVPKKQGGER